MAVDRERKEGGREREARGLQVLINGRILNGRTTRSKPQLSPDLRSVQEEQEQEGRRTKNCHHFRQRWQHFSSSNTERQWNSSCKQLHYGVRHSLCRVSSNHCRRTFRTFRTLPFEPYPVIVRPMPNLDPNRFASENCHFFKYNYW